MDIKRLTDRAKGLFQKRGGMDALKEDAAELKDVASGEGSVTDKAKRAADALKDPGAEGEAQGGAERETPGEPAGAERTTPGEHAEAERTKPAEGRNGGGGAA